MYFVPGYELRYALVAFRLKLIDTSGKTDFTNTRNIVNDDVETPKVLNKVPLVM